MIDKYEAHNRKVISNSDQHTFLTVIPEAFYDACEERGVLHLLDLAVVSRPLKAFVEYKPIRPKYLGKYGGRKVYVSKRIKKK